MKKKLIISAAVCFFNGIAFFPSSIIADDSSSSSNLSVKVNVEALLAPHSNIQCYVHTLVRETYCWPLPSLEGMCALCDDEVIITPPKPDEGDGPTNEPGQ
jgi:hypothetical protein